MTELAAYVEVVETATRELAELEAVPHELLPEPHERSAAALAPAVVRRQTERAERRSHREERRAAILRGDLYA